MANRIKESNITPGAVTSDKIAPGTISASNITPGTITGSLLAPATVESSNIAPGTIANDRLANTGITINGTTIALGASGTIVAGTDWQSVVTADGSTATTASAGEGYFIDTTSNAHTINLPSSPTQGDEVHIIDYAGTFGTNNVTVGRNGSNIDGVAVNATLSTNRLNIRFVYIDATQGWRAIFDDVSENYGSAYVAATGGTITTSGDFKIHTFTGDGCFVVSCGGNPGGSDTVDYLVVAGGGAGGTGGTGESSGGGGGGGYREAKTGNNGCHTASPLATPTGITVSATTYSITVGGGGASGQPLNVPGNPGSNSVFATITSAGGAGGRGGGIPVPQSNGGSGGGGNGYADNTGGAGNTPPVSPPQGNPGGLGLGNPDYAGAGGGGAGAAGSNASGAAGGTGGPGGCGSTSSINNTPTTRSGGGGGGAFTARGPAGGAGPGGGGAGAVTGTATPGTANTGGGGGGTSCGGTAGAGGKGIVIIRYKFQN